MYYKRLAKTYNINIYKNGKAITYNKLKNKIIDYENKKYKLTEEEKLYNNIMDYLEDKIKDEELNNALYYYIGKYFFSYI